VLKQVDTAGVTEIGVCKLWPSVSTVECFCPWVNVTTWHNVVNTHGYFLCLLHFVCLNLHVWTLQENITFHLHVRCFSVSMVDQRQSFHWGEVQHKAPTVGGEEYVCSHHVHCLLVTLPYAPAVRLLITPMCDSRTAKVMGTRWPGEGAWEKGSVNSVSVWVCYSEIETWKRRSLCSHSKQRRKW